MRLIDRLTARTSNWGAFKLLWQRMCETVEGLVTEVGYSSGGRVTQQGTKTADVTLDAMSGQIVTSNATLAAATTTAFLFRNAHLRPTDMLVLAVANGGTAGAYQAWVSSMADGECLVALRNMTSSNLTQEVTLNFAIIRGAVG